MPKVLFNSRLYKPAKFIDEKEFEKVVVSHSDKIFGEQTVYLDVKRKIRSRKGRLGSIPDGYVISFVVGASPKLFIVENELSEHDELEIAQQLLKYQATFKEGQYQTKAILHERLRAMNQLVMRLKNC